MTRLLTLLPALLLTAAPAFAEGDAAAGEKDFNKCKACHAITADDGTDIVKGGKVGPNLYGVVGRAVASVEDFSYGADLAALGETGAVWDEASLAEYMADPREYLKTALDNPKAKSKMVFRLKSGGEDVAAYLASVGPQS
ncbi:cytochrome C [Sulfitobacter sp. D35]|uniref:c-type cytochrome n=1 Tax=Sulfitobacter sp. D35 TaxID=3083252 RepID=UPI00296EB9B1|nr:cytochrome C [Sulfitobacter sp. D35]MDW4499250.1 cytochrome C [Sulfitobacter sp. D35]